MSKQPAKDRYQEMFGSHESVATNMARADKSDPFTYARVMSHQQIGLHIKQTKDGVVNCYNADWRKESRTVEFAGEHLHFEVDVPHNMARV